MNGNGNGNGALDTPDVPLRRTRRAAARAAATSPPSAPGPRGGRPTPGRRLARALLGLTLAGALCGAATAALADGGPRAPVSGELLALEQTPHLWAVDAAGTAHLASDPFALAEHAAAGAPRTAVSLDELRQLPRGEPWLSMALVKLGDFVYLPQAQAPGTAPVLRLVKSVDDLSLLGVGADNYGRLVLDRAAWEARYGFNVDGLRYDTFSLDGQPAVVAPWESSQTPVEIASATA
jgi:hypothetical protein